MYPQAELTELARAKAALRQSIAGRRRASAEALAVATQPLVWLDAGLGLWRRFAPLAKGAVWPLGAVALPALFRPPKMIRGWLRWAPPVVRALLALRRLRRHRGTQTAAGF
jgi:hypothetical protein